jgi:hypothetical protein
MNELWALNNNQDKKINRTKPEIMALKKQQITFLFFALMAVSLISKSQIPQHKDNLFTQDYSVKFINADNDAQLLKVVSDRNGYIQVLSSKGLLRPRAGQFLFPGTLVTDEQDKQTSDKKIAGIGTYENQLIYIDNQAVLSNAWAGKLFSKHTMPEAKIFAGGKDFTFLISDGNNLILLKDSKKLWEGNLSGEKVKDIKYDNGNNLFWILGSGSIQTFSSENEKLTKVYAGKMIH